MANLFDTTNASTTEPEKIVAGDRLIWKRTDLNADYDNAAFTLKYSARLEGTGSTEIEITASAFCGVYLTGSCKETCPKAVLRYPHLLGHDCIILWVG